MIAGLFLFSHSYSQPFFDDFSGSFLDSNWIEVSPNPDSDISLTGNGHLSVKASVMNGGSDLWPTINFNAPRLLRQVSGDWEIETKMEFAPDTYYQAAGLVLVRDSVPGSTNIDKRVAAREKGLANFIPDRSTILTLQVYDTSSFIFFRLRKEGTLLTCYYSLDSTIWEMGVVSDKAENDLIQYAGLFAARQHNVGLAPFAEALFDYFKFVQISPDTCQVIVQDTIIVMDTLVVYDSMLVTVFDTVAVTDTLIIPVLYTSTPSPMLSQMKVFPNPTKEDLIVDLENPNALNQFQLELLNELGQIVRQDTISQAGPIIFNLSNLSSGLYHLLVRQANGMIVETRKIKLL